MRTHLLVCTAASLLFVVPTAARADDAPAKLQRDQLLFYQDKDGTIRPVKTVADWQKRRTAILAAMQTVMGPLPGKAKRVPLDAKIEEEVDCGDYVRRVVSYQAEPGGRVSAYLLVPKKLLKEGGTAPGILSLHPTNAKGKRSTVGLADAKNRTYGVELARRGYVVLAPPYPLLSDYNPDLKKLGYQSGTMKAIWDNVRGLDYLDSLPFVQKGNYAAIGHSLGGHNSIFTAAFDERIKATVSSCGLDSYRDYMGGKIKGWTSTRYMPKLWDYHDQLDRLPFDFYETVAAIAPRRVLIAAPKGDTNFRWKSAAAVARAARAVYALYGAKDDLRIIHPDCTHDFPDAVRQEAYRFIDAALKQ